MSEEQRTRARTTPGTDDSPSAPTAQERNVVLRSNRLDSRDIFLHSREIIIAHGDDTYRLRLTAQNKLILTK